MADRKINARQPAEDVGQVLHDNKLIKKYELPSSELRKAFERLLDAGPVTSEDLRGRAT